MTFGSREGSLLSLLTQQGGIRGKMRWNQVRRGRLSGNYKVLGIIADNLSKAGWSPGWVSALDLNGRTIWITDAHRRDGKRFIVRADEKLTAFSGTGIRDSGTR